MLAVNEINQSWSMLAPYIEAYKSKKQYSEAKNLLRELMTLKPEQRTLEVKSFAKTLAREIASYENNHYDFTTNVEATDVLKYLMKEHGLRQSDFPEIGSQALISNILKGERSLTVNHIKLLSKRFNVSASTFF